MKRRATRTTLKKDWKPIVLAGIASGMTLRDAAARATVDRVTVYRHLQKDEEFAEAFHEAEKESADLLEAEARRRAVEGTERKKFHQGRAIMDPATGQQYIEREYSDTLLIFLLKGRRPEVFAEKVDLTSGGKAVTFTLNIGERTIDGSESS